MFNKLGNTLTSARIGKRDTTWQVFRNGYQQNLRFSHSNSGDERVSSYATFRLVNNESEVLASLGTPNEKIPNLNLNLDAGETMWIGMWARFNDSNLEMSGASDKRLLWTLGGDNASNVGPPQFFCSLEKHATDDRPVIKFTGIWDDYDQLSLDANLYESGGSTIMSDTRWHFIMIGFMPGDYNATTGGGTTGYHSIQVVKPTSTNSNADAAVYGNHGGWLLDAPNGDEYDAFKRLTNDNDEADITIGGSGNSNYPTNFNWDPVDAELSLVPGMQWTGFTIWKFPKLDLSNITSSEYHIDNLDMTKIWQKGPFHRVDYKEEYQVVNISTDTPYSTRSFIDKYNCIADTAVYPNYSSTYGTQFEDRDTYADETQGIGNYTYWAFNKFGAFI